MAAPRLSTQRFPGAVCRNCGRDIPKGETFMYHPYGGYRKLAQCLDCANAETPRTPEIKTTPRTPGLPTPPPAPQSIVPVEDAQREAKMRATVRTVINAILDDESESWKADITAKVMAKVDAKAQKIVADMMANATRNIIRLQRQDGEVIKLDLAHATMPRLLKRINARIHTYVWGPAGTGKTHAALQACTACGIPDSNVFLESCNPFFTPHNYTGYQNALGNYTESALYRFLACDGPAAFIVDEFDRQRPDAPSVLNSLLAQGFITFPNGERQYLTDGKFIIALGNTNMRGGSTAYSAASRQERSTIDRFSYLYWGIDETLEATIANALSPDHARVWHQWIKAVRVFLARPENRNLDEISPTPRSTYDGLKQIVKCGDSYSEAAEDNVFKGLAADTKDKILAACPLPR